MEFQFQRILEHCHLLQADGHHGAVRTASRVLQSGFYWPTLQEDAHNFVSNCEACQGTRNLERRPMKPLNWVNEIDAYDVWEVSLMGPLLHSGEREFILVAVDYASQWAEIIALGDREFFRIERFILKHIVRRFGTPMMVISDDSLEYCSAELDALMERQGSRHQKYESEYLLSTGERKKVNWELKRLLEITVETTLGNWPNCIKNTLWAYRTGFQLPMDVSPYRYLFSYSCPLPARLKQICHWNIKLLNSDCMRAREPVLLKFKESGNWKNKVEDKAPCTAELATYADHRWLNSDFFQIGQEVMVFHTQLRVFPAELKSEWKGPYTIVKVFNDGALEVQDENEGRRLKVAKQRSRHFNRNEIAGMQSLTMTRTR